MHGRHHWHHGHHWRGHHGGFPVAGFFFAFLLFMLLAKGFLPLLLIGIGAYLLLSRNRHWSWDEYTKPKRAEDDKPKNDDEDVVYYV